MIKDIKNIIDDLTKFNDEHKDYLLSYKEFELGSYPERKATFNINKFSLPKIDSYTWSGGGQIKDNLLIYNVVFVIKTIYGKDYKMDLLSEEKIKVAGRCAKTSKFKKIFDFKSELIKLGLEKFFGEIVNGLIKTEFYDAPGYVEDFSQTEMPDYIRKYLILS